MQITRGKVPGAVKVGVYGVEGIGKTTFAARFPDPLFIDTEDGTVHMDVKRLPKPDSWGELMGEVEYVHNHPDCCRTLVLDTADWAERLCIESVCAEHQVEGIEAFSYGKGYVFAQEEFGRLLDRLELVRRLGINIVIVAHAMMRKFEQPEETGAYDRWELKLSKKIAPMVREWVDALIFVNYKVLVVNVDNKGAAKGKNKVQGGKRVMYMAHHACWDAKNRFGWPEEADFSYEVVRGVIEGGATSSVTDSQTPSPEGGPLPSPASPAPPSPEGEGKESPSALARAVERAAAPAAPAAAAPAAVPAEGAADAQYAGLPDGLVRMMREAQVTPEEVRYVIAQKGIYPANTPWAVLCANEQFMNGWLMHPQVWPKVVEMAINSRDDVPF